MFILNIANIRLTII